MSTIARVEGDSVGGIARAIEDMSIAARNARLRKLRRTRLRAAMLTIDQLLEELEHLNLEGRSRPLSAWQHSLFSLRRLDPKAASLELPSEMPPERLMDVLFELQGRLMRDLAGPNWDSLIADENSSECAGKMSLQATRDGSPLRRDL